MTPTSRPWTLLALLLAASLWAMGCPEDDDDDAADDDTSDDDTGDDDTGDDDTGDDDTGDDDTVDYFNWYDHEEGTITGCTGLDIHWETYTYNQGTPEMTLVFSHGRREYAPKYALLVPGFEGKPWNFVYYDLMGMGRSGGVPAHAMDYDTEYVCDLDTVIDAKVDKGLPMALMSHSTGGLINLRWAQLHPGEAFALVASSSLHGIWHATYNMEQLHGLSELYGGTDGWEALAYDPEPYPPCKDEEQNYNHDCDLYAESVADPLNDCGPPTYGWLYSSVEACWNLDDNAALNTDPILMLQAGMDTIVLNEEQDEFCDLVNAANPGTCSVTEHPDDFHEILRELDRETAYAEAIAHIETHLPTK